MQVSRRHWLQPSIGPHNHHLKILRFQVLTEASAKTPENCPTVDAFRECVQAFDPHLDEQNHVKTQLTALLDFFETVNKGYKQAKKLPPLY